MRLGVALLCLAACSGGTGVDLEIRSGVAIESVEIFIGTQDCYEADNSPCVGGVAWLAGQSLPPGKTYVQERKDLLPEARLVPERVDDTFTIHLEASGHFTNPRVIAVVGFDAQGQAVAVGMVWDERIPAHSAAHWVVELEAADPAVLGFRGAPTDTSTPLRVAVWGRGGDEAMAAGSRCAAVQKWDDVTHEWTGTFIVPDSDRDCDGVVDPQLECRDRYFNLNTNRTERASCVAHEPATPGDLPGPCVVGATECRDGASANDDCQVLAPTSLRERICVPDGICDLCTEPYGLETCLATAAKQTTSVSHVECPFAADSAGLSCDYGHPGVVAAINLPFACETIELRNLSMPLMSATEPYMVGDAQFDFETIISSNSCTIRLSFIAGTALHGSRNWVLLGVWSPYSATVMLVPLRIDFSTVAADCTAFVQEPAKCLLVGVAEDTIGQCAGLVNP